MKAIYLNLDPYLQAIADWINAGRTGPAPKFNPLPVAVTIPLGESAAIFVQNNDGNYSYNPEVSVDGATIGVFSPTASVSPLGDPIAERVDPKLSAVFTGGNYSVYAVSGDISIAVVFQDTEEGNDFPPVTFTVLVRRETASGPVDLVEFTPPAAAIAAGTDLKGTKFNGNEIVAAAGTGALSAPAGA